MRPHPNTCKRSPSAGLDDAAWVTATRAEPASRTDTRGLAPPRSRSTFAVDEAADPLLSMSTFLLIDRTGRIVTAHCHMIPGGCDNERVPPDARCFQHLASCTVRN